MEKVAKEDRRETEVEEKKPAIAKKRKKEPEVTIAPSGPGGPDISVE